MVLKILITVFVLCTLSELLSEYRKKRFSPMLLVFWIIVWLAIFLVVWFPVLTFDLARLLNIVRGIDAVVYLAVVVLFYVLFRLLMRLEKIERDITAIVRAESLKNIDRNK